jgi:hypothetical protein
MTDIYSWKTKGQPLEEGANKYYMLASSSQLCPSQGPLALKGTFPSEHYQRITRTSPPSITTEHHQRASPASITSEHHQRITSEHHQRITSALMHGKPFQ